MSQFNRPGLASEVVDREWVPKMYKEKRGEQISNVETKKSN